MKSTPLTAVAAQPLLRSTRLAPVRAHVNARPCRGWEEPMAPRSFNANGMITETDVLQDPMIQRLRISRSLMRPTPLLRRPNLDISATVNSEQLWKTCFGTTICKTAKASSDTPITRQPKKLGPTPHLSGPKGTRLFTSPSHLGLSISTNNGKNTRVSSRNNCSNSRSNNNSSRRSCKNP